MCLAYLLRALCFSTARCFSFGATAQDLPEVRLQWMESVECFGPDNFSTFQRSVKDESPSASLK